MAEIPAFPLRRPIDALSRRFDLLVIGGGIYGAWTAYDAASRGLSVALVEARDWGSGTSSASSKLIHGGLRYLEQFEFSLVRQALREREVLSRIAPHLVQPLRFLLPVWRDSRASRITLEAGLTLYDVMAGRHQPVGPHRRLGRTGLLNRRPELAADGLLGGFDYGDCQEDDARLTLEVVGAAQAAGAICVSRMRALGIAQDASQGLAVQLRDELGTAVYSASAKAVVVAAGPWSSHLVGAEAPAIKLIKGVHLVMPALPGRREALLLTAPQDGRVFFVIPWYGRTLLGTTEAQVADPSQARVEDSERDYLLEAARARLPGIGWQTGDVIAAYCGVRTLQDDHAQALSAVTREFEVREVRPGLWLPIGGKYTTSRHDAAHIVDRVIGRKNRSSPMSITRRRPLPGAPPKDASRWRESASSMLRGYGVDDDAIESLLRRFGLRVSRIGELLQEQPSWAARIVDELPFIGAEVIIARRDEMALDREDVVRRRIPLALVARESQWAETVERLLASA